MRRNARPVCRCVALRRPTVASNHPADGGRGGRHVSPAAQRIRGHSLGHLGRPAEQGAHHRGHRAHPRQWRRRLHDQQLAAGAAQVSLPRIYGPGEDCCPAVQEKWHESLDRNRLRLSRRIRRRSDQQGLSAAGHARHPRRRPFHCRRRRYARYSAARRYPGHPGLSAPRGGGAGRARADDQAVAAAG